MKKQAISLLTSIIMAMSFVSVLPAAAADKLISGDYEYAVLDDGTVKILKYNGSDLNLTIPSTIEGKTVTKIYYDAFIDCAFESITADADNQYFSSENGVLFNKDKTEVIRYPSLSERKSYAIPNGVTNIYSYSFYECDKLLDITIPDSVTTIGNGAFYNCRKLRGNIVIPDGVTKISDGAFMNCFDLYSVVLGNSVESIGFRAFDGCLNIMSVTMPKSLKSIHWSSFDYVNSVFTIKCYIGTVAEQYAINYGFKYELLDPELQGTVYYQTKASESAVRFIAEVDIDDVANADQSNVKIMFNGQETSVQVTKAYGSLIANGQKIEAQEGKCFIISPAIMTSNDGGDIISSEFTLDGCNGSIIREITV